MPKYRKIVVLVDRSNYDDKGAWPVAGDELSVVREQRGRYWWHRMTEDPTAIPADVEAEDQGVWRVVSTSPHYPRVLDDDLVQRLMVTLTQEPR